jgi:hypothetical protein
MKTRQAFVSNSSSSSFYIPRSKLTEEQIEQIENHIKIDAEESLNSGEVHIGVNPEDIKWSDWPDWE